MNAEQIGMQVYSTKNLEELETFLVHLMMTCIMDLLTSIVEYRNRTIPIHNTRCETELLDLVKFIDFDGMVDDSLDICNQKLFAAHMTQKWRQ
jgi:hypothetical protein